MGNAEHLAVVGRASAALAPCCNVVGVHFVELIDPALVRVVANRTERAVGFVLRLWRVAQVSTPLSFLLTSSDRGCPMSRDFRDMGTPTVSTMVFRPLAFESSTSELPSR